MKRIEAVIRQDRLTEVKRALARGNHHGVTVCGVKEQDPKGEVTVRWRGQSRIHDLVPRVSVSVLVDDGDARATVDAIVSAARTTGECDGTVVVMPVDEVVRISSAAACA